jgi:hypothetical protein
MCSHRPLTRDKSATTRESPRTSKRVLMESDKKSLSSDMRATAASQSVVEAAGVLGASLERALSQNVGPTFSSL